MSDDWVFVCPRCGEELDIIFCPSHDRPVWVESTQRTVYLPYKPHEHLFDDSVSGYVEHRCDGRTVTTPATRDPRELGAVRQRSKRK